MTSRHGRNISAYRSIPYAKPPIGNLRFKKPELTLENAWQGVKDGSLKIPSCIQPSRGLSLLSKIKGTEDCLYLNVYVPQVSKVPSQGFPVMVWIHGGGFLSGDGSDGFYGPSNLLDKDIILVTLNYRLGIFGFLTAGNEEMPGNLGLWDQLGALKWVQKNIKAFDGNPEKVTIFGESAGGWSVSYQMASKQSKNLYSAAIVQSGPLDMGLLYVEKLQSLDDVHKTFIDKVGCSAKESVIECLQALDSDEVMKHYQMFDSCNGWLKCFNLSN